jgi:hypothetical protein
MMEYLIHLQFKIKLYENVIDLLDIKFMYLLILVIDQSYYLHSIYLKKLDELILIIIYFYIN